MSGLLSQKFGFLVKLLTARLDQENVRYTTSPNLLGLPNGSSGVSTKHRLARELKKVVVEYV
jgi:hypothetical protein